MGASIAAYRNANPGAIWSMSANGHGRLSTIALWSAFPQEVRVFHLNMWKTGSRDDQAAVVNETKEFLLTLQVIPTFVLHDGDLFDTDEPRQTLPFQHLMTRLVELFSRVSFSLTYGTNFPPLTRALWGSGFFKAALLETNLNDTFNIFDRSFDGRLRYPRRYILNEPPGIPALFDGVAEARLLAAIDRHTPPPKEPTLNGLPAPHNLFGMNQTTSAIFNIIRLLWARKTPPVAAGNTNQLLVV